MKLTCDVCGSKLEMQSESTLCTGCGVKYSKERLQEKLQEIVPIAEYVPAKKAPPEVRNAYREADEKTHRRFMKMWKYFGYICIIAFVGTLLADTPRQTAMVFVFCVAATLLDFLLYMPRKNEGGQRK